MTSWLVDLIHVCHLSRAPSGSEESCAYNRCAFSNVPSARGRNNIAHCVPFLIALSFYL